MPTPKFYGHSNCAKTQIIYEKQNLLEAYLKSFKPDTRLEIVIKKYVPKRTDSQNKYYWGVVVKMIADYTGMDKDSTHDGLRQIFLKVEHEKLPTIKSTAKLSTIEFAEYIEQCVIWAATFLGLVIPDPYAIEY